MSCEYCNGSGKKLPLDEFATDSELFVVEACLEGVDEANPVVWVNADGACIYVRAEYCIKCGSKLGENRDD